MTCLISAYLTTRNAAQMDFPFVESIKSCFEFADEVVVLDTSDGTDSTVDQLNSINNPKLKVYHETLDWSAPNHGVFDGKTKQLARERCTGAYLWQMDADEVVHENHAPMIRNLVESYDWPQQPQTLALPVIDFWGTKGNVRTDVNIWKWRVSPNHPEISHGIPIYLRKYENGLLYANPGTDGCDYISKTTGYPIPCAGYVPEQVEMVRRMASTNKDAAQILERFINDSIEQLPGVFHYSWFDIKRKIENYRVFWSDSWKSLYNENRDERTNPIFPGKLWSEVTEDMVIRAAQELQEGTGGWVFHHPWDGSRTNSIRLLNYSHPSIMKTWIDNHSNKY